MFHRTIKSSSFFLYTQYIRVFVCVYRICFVFFFLLHINVFMIIATAIFYSAILGGILLLVPSAIVLYGTWHLISGSQLSIGHDNPSVFSWWLLCGLILLLLFIWLCTLLLCWSRICNRAFLRVSMPNNRHTPRRTRLLRCANIIGKPILAINKNDISTVVECGTGNE